MYHPLAGVMAQNKPANAKEKRLVTEIRRSFIRKIKAYV